MRDKLRSLFSFLKKDERVEKKTKVKINVPLKSLICFCRNFAIRKNNENFYDTKAKKNFSIVTRTIDCQYCDANIVIMTTKSMQF